MLSYPLTLCQVPNETFKAAAHLVVTGKKRRFPNANIILAHLGGSTPFLAARVAALSRHMGCPLTHEEILEDFKSFYFDTALSSHATTLAAMKSFVGGDRILFGTDFPGTGRGPAAILHACVDSFSFVMGSVAVSTETVEWYTKNAEDFYADDRDLRERIMHGTAKALLRL